MSELSDSGAANDSQLDRLKNANKTRWSKHEVRVLTPKLIYLLSTL